MLYSIHCHYVEGSDSTFSTAFKASGSPHHLLAEKSQVPLEGKVLSPQMVNMGIAVRAVKTNVIHHID